MSHSVSLFSCIVSRMKYPNRLSPQQIQGMDYKALETLLVWLKEKIIEIRNSLPSYESLAAQQLFEDEFCFDASDAPPESVSSLWFPTNSTCSADLQSTTMLSCKTTSTISTSAIRSEPQFLPAIRAASSRLSPICKPRAT